MKKAKQDKKPFTKAAEAADNKFDTKPTKGKVGAMPPFIKGKGGKKGK